MIPNIIRVRARSLGEFGDLVRHAGEEYIFVVEGQIIVNTEFYDPVTLQKGQSIYIDSEMGHAYIVGEECQEAVILAVMASADENLMSKLITIHDERTQENGAA